MKVFISMKMKSKNKEQIKQEMNKIFEVIKEKLPDAELIDSVLDGTDKDIAINGDDSGIWYLGKSLQLLAEADLVFFVNDWQEARGCRIEREVAHAYGKFCIELKIN